jgi:hypothetical protein
MGWLPRAALEIVSSEHLSAHKWDGKWRRDSEAEIVIKSDSDAVTVSGMQRGEAAILTASRPAQSTLANSKVPPDHGVGCWPSAMTLIDQDFRHRKKQRNVRRSWS